MAALGLSAYGTEPFDTELEPWVEPVREVGLYLFGSQENLQMMFVGACLLHVMEGLLSIVYAVKEGYSYLQILMWFIQTSLLGYPSLRLIKVNNHHTK